MGKQLTLEGEEPGHRPFLPTYLLLAHPLTSVYPSNLPIYTTYLSLPPTYLPLPPPTCRQSVWGRGFGLSVRLPALQLEGLYRFGARSAGERERLPRQPGATKAH